MAETDIYMAKVRFVDFPEPNRPVPVLARTTARAGHPIIDRNPGVWEPLRVDYDLEQPAAGPMADDADPEVARLKWEAAQLGVNVDGRWSTARLRREIDKARAEAGA